MSESNRPEAYKHLMERVRAQQDADRPRTNTNLLKVIAVATSIVAVATIVTMIAQLVFTIELLS